ncbi:amidohydrolase family protein [Streptomyces sp. NPDC048191]|uniref:amidohydrolase family protein n=1 Tax=Streptomyces sp. NPDC048191 TaxID=3155484 RepID=UPI0033DB1B91
MSPCQAATLPRGSLFHGSEERNDHRCARACARPRRSPSRRPRRGRRRQGRPVPHPSPPRARHRSGGPAPGVRRAGHRARRDRWIAGGVRRRSAGGGRGRRRPPGAVRRLRVRAAGVAGRGGRTGRRRGRGGAGAARDRGADARAGAGRRRLEPVLRAAADHGGLPVVVHGFAPTTAEDLRTLAALSRRHPRVPLVVSQLGGLHWMEAIELVRDTPGMYLELSTAFLVLAVRLAVRELPERALFGSDAPYGDPVVARTTVERATRSAEVRERVLGGNAAALLGITGDAR